MSSIGLLVFDEAHHCASDHPYAQIMEDFYHTSKPMRGRPQVLGLTASPVSLEGMEAVAGKSSKNKKKKSSEWGLQGMLDARVVTVAPQHR